MSELKNIANGAKEASRMLGNLSSEIKNKALIAISEDIIKNTDKNAYIISLDKDIIFNKVLFEKINYEQIVIVNFHRSNVYGLSACL